MACSFIYLLSPHPIKLIYLNLTHLKLCLATTTHNFKWVKITRVYLTWDQNFQILMLKQSFHSQYQWFGRKKNDVISRIRVNPCSAELFQLYFSSFEAGIANAISSFKWRKILLFMKNRHV